MYFLLLSLLVSENAPFFNIFIVHVQAFKISLESRVYHKASDEGLHEFPLFEFFC